jgi:hypothetical protein
MVREKKYRQQYEVVDEPQFGMMDPESPPDATFDLETVEFEGYVGEAKSIFDQIHDEIDERRKEGSGVYPRVIILGEYEYTALDAWIRNDSNGKESLETQFSEDIYTVPGRQIHVPRKNESVPSSYLSDD